MYLFKYKTLNSIVKYFFYFFYFLLLILVLNLCVINYNVTSNVYNFLNVVTPSSIFFASTFLFVTGLVGLFFNNTNFLLVLLKIEIMFLGLNLLFITFAVYYMNLLGLVYSLVLLGLVAAETVLGLSIFLYVFLTRKNLVLGEATETVYFFVK